MPTAASWSGPTPADAVASRMVFCTASRTLAAPSWGVLTLDSPIGLPARTIAVWILVPPMSTPAVSATRQGYSVLVMGGDLAVLVRRPGPPRAVGAGTRGTG